MSETTFRARIEETPQEEPVAEPVETPNVIEGRVDGALKDADHVDEVERESPLDTWEIEHGKYGHDYFGIKEIAKEFPLNANFSVVDKYIREWIQDDGYDLTKEAWQERITELETELNTMRLSAYDRLNKLANYIKVVNKMKDLQKKKELYKV